MILALVFVTLGNAVWTNRVLSCLPAGPRNCLVRAFKVLQAAPPAALGKPFEKK
jgi:hypothetical protein